MKIVHEYLMLVCLDIINDVQEKNMIQNKLSFSSVINMTVCNIFYQLVSTADCLML